MWLFFSDMILLMVCTSIFSSWVSVYVSVFAVHESLSCSVWLGVSGFPLFIFSVSVVGVWWCVYLYICRWISSISRSAGLWFVTLNLPKSVQISIVLFHWVASKIWVECLFVILPSPFSTLWCLMWVVDLFIVCIPKRRIIYVARKRTANIRRMPFGSSMLLSREHLLIMTPKHVV